MSEDRDFYYITGKLPKKDKNGNDTSGDKMGIGGRHRDDGTFSSMPYDIEIVDHDPSQVEPPKKANKKPIQKTETIIVFQAEPERPQEPSRSEKVANYIANTIETTLSNPEVQDALAKLFEVLWQYKVKPRIKKAIKRLKGKEHESTNIVTSSRQSVSAEGSKTLSTDSAQGVKLTISPEQAEMLIQLTKEQASRLAKMIFVLSNICVKDEKTEEEYMLEESYIKQLTTKEAVNTMRYLVENKQLLDDNTALCLSDYLNGYLRNGEQLIPIPRLSESENKDVEYLNRINE